MLDSSLNVNFAQNRMPVNQLKNYNNQNISFKSQIDTDKTINEIFKNPAIKQQMINLQMKIILDKIDELEKKSDFTKKFDMITNITNIHEGLIPRSQYIYDRDELVDNVINCKKIADNYKTLFALNKSNAKQNLKLNAKLLKKAIENNLYVKSFIDKETENKDLHKKINTKDLLIYRESLGDLSDLYRELCKLAPNNAQIKQHAAEFKKQYLELSSDKFLPDSHKYI